MTGKQPSLFSRATLSCDSNAYLDAHMQRRSILKNEQFLWEGDSLEAVYWVLEGYIKVFHLSKDGREQVLSIITPGKLFNTVSVLQHESGNHAHAAALSDASLGILKTEDFLYLIEHFPDFSMLVLRDFSGKLAHLTALVEQLALSTTRQRLIRFLLANKQADQGIKGWTQEEIAAQVGTVRDVVSRLLGVLVREGLIKVERQRIILVDLERLYSEIEE